MLAGKFALARSHFEEVLALYDPLSGPSLVRQAAVHPHVASQAQLGMVLLCLGYSDQALARISAAITEARRLAHPPTFFMSLAFGTRVLSLIGDDATLDEWADQLVAGALEQGFADWVAYGRIGRGWVEVKHGHVKEGMSLLRTGSNAFRVMGGTAGCGLRHSGAN
jgi:hypothetical protein